MAPQSEKPEGLDKPSSTFQLLVFLACNAGLRVVGDGSLRMKDFFQLTLSLILRTPYLAAGVEWWESSQQPTPSLEASFLELILCAYIA